MESTTTTNVNMESRNENSTVEAINIGTVNDKDKISIVETKNEPMMMDMKSDTALDQIQTNTIAVQNIDSISPSASSIQKKSPENNDSDKEKASYHSKDKFSSYDLVTESLRRSGRDRKSTVAFSPVSPSNTKQEKTSQMEQNTVHDNDDDNDDLENDEDVSSNANRKRKRKQVAIIFSCIVCSKKFDNLRGLRAHFGHKRDDIAHSRVMEKALLTAASEEEEINIGGHNNTPVPATREMRQRKTRVTESPVLPRKRFKTVAMASSHILKDKTKSPKNNNNSHKRNKNSHILGNNNDNNTNSNKKKSNLYTFSSDDELDIKQSPNSALRMRKASKRARENCSDFLEMYSHAGNQGLIGYLRHERQWLLERLRFVTSQLKEQERIDHCRNQLEFLLHAYKVPNDNDNNNQHNNNNNQDNNIDKVMISSSSSSTSSSNIYPPPKE